MIPETYPIAIIGDGQITTSSGSRPYPTDRLDFVTDLAEIALTPALPYRALWIAPGSDLARLAAEPGFWQARHFSLWHIFATGPQDSTPDVAAVRRNDVSGPARREVMIYSGLDTRWLLDFSEFGDSPSTHTWILNAVTTYERQMGVYARLSPASTALALLQAIHNKCQQVAYLDALSRDTMRGVPWPINRAPAHANQWASDGKYVHVFDKRSAYMASAMCEVGRGDPILYAPMVSGGFQAGWEDVIKRETPGLWCISATQPIDMSPQDRERLPSPFNNHGDFPDHEWYYTPQVKLALEMGYQVQLHEGYYWPKHHRTLRPWVQRLWDARQATQGTPVEAMIKASFTQSLGVMSRRPGEAEKLQWYHRPDWVGTLTAQNYLRLVKKIMSIEQITPGYLACSTDSIAWTSDDFDWRTALPPGWRGPDGQLGQYRHVASYEGDEAQWLIEMARDGQGAARLYKQMEAWDDGDD